MVIYKNLDLATLKTVYSATSKDCSLKAELTQKDNLDQNLFRTCCYFFLAIVGLEDFENKVDKVTKGTEGDENSWISQIFYKYGHAIFDINEDLKSMEGLEPPMLDETWGFDKIDDNEIPTLEIQRTHKPNEDQFEKELEGD